jgi:hypothetical protein
MDEMRARRLGQARSVGVGLIAGIVVLTMWGLAAPVSSGVVFGFDDLISGLYDHDAAVFSAMVVAGLLSFLVTPTVAYVWHRFIEARRFGDRRVPRRPGDRWAWPMCFLAFLFLSRVFDPLASLPTGAITDTAWVVIPAGYAMWGVIALALGVGIPFVAWRAVYDLAFDDPDAEMDELPLVNPAR